jgi:hypothetical protein
MFRWVNKPAVIAPLVSISEFLRMPGQRDADGEMAVKKATKGRFTT